MKNMIIKQLDELNFDELYSNNDELYPNIRAAMKKLTQKIRVKQVQKHDGGHAGEETGYLANAFPHTMITNQHLRHRHS